MRPKEKKKEGKEETRQRLEYDTRFDVTRQMMGREINMRDK